MTIDEIRALTSEDVKKMKKSELREVLREANKKATVRRSKLRAAQRERELPVPTVLRESGIGSWEDWTFSNKDASIMTLRRRLNLTVEFLRAETGTVSGWQKTVNKFLQRVTGMAKKEDGDIKYEYADKKLFGKERLKSPEINISDTEYKRFWEVLSKLTEAHPTLEQTYDSNQLQQLVYSYMVKEKGRDVLEILQIMEDDLELNISANRKAEPEEQPSFITISRS